MDSYYDYRDRQRPYGRHEDSEPEDIDGPPPLGYPFNDARPPPSNHPHWAPPTFMGGPEYRTSPPRGGYGRYPYSPERGRQPRAEGIFPEVFPRMDAPPVYPDYGGLPSYGSEYGHGDYDYTRGHSHGDYDYVSRPPVYPPDGYDRRPPPREDFEHGHGHGDYDRRPPPREEFELRPPPREEFEHRPPPPEVFPPGPPPRHVQFDPEVQHIHEEPRLNASDGRPPLPYEPDPHFHGHEPAPPPVMAFPPVVERVASPPRGPPAGDGGGAPFIPPMPYEPGVGIAVGVGGGGVSPPPIQLMTHDRAPPEGEGVFIPPMPYEPERSPKLHGHGHPGEFPLDRGDVGPVPYDPAMGIPPPFPDPLYGVATGHEHVKRKHFEGCKDYWAGFLFLLHFWAVVGVCIYLGVRGVIKTNQNNDLIREYELAPAPAPPVPTELYSIKHWAPQLAAATASGWLFAFIWQWLIRSKLMIKVCLSLGAISTGLLGIILVSTGTAKGLVGLIFLVSALFQGLYVHLVRQRIPFASIMLNKSRLVVKHYRSLHVIATWTVFIAMLWLAIWIFGVAGAVSLPYGGWYAALLVLSLAWSMEVLRNIVYVTVAGVVSTYYYEGREHMPRLPVLRAYQRAWTISFGSVCLGSMFVGPVQTLHVLAKRLANEQGANEFLFSCVNCFLGVLDFFNKHFNKWAFVEVGLHGKSFVKAAKQTWHMFKVQGAMLLINDDLTGAILLTSCIIGGVLTALVGGCWTFATYRYLTVGVSIISFFIGFFVTYLTLVVQESAVATYYVCFAEDSATLHKHDPPFWQYMNDRKLKLDQEID